MSVAEDPPTPIQQVLRCASLLREGWHAKADLAERLGVTERTVKRYLAAIEAEHGGFEVRELDDRGTRQYRLRDVSLRDHRAASRYEVLALAIAQRFFQAFDPGGIADLLDQMLLDITGEDGEDGAPVDRSLRSLGRRFVLARAPQPLSGEVRLVFDTVLRAVVEQRVVALDYEGRSGGLKSHVLRPYTLLLGEQELAVIGAVHEPGPGGSARPGEPIRTFALHRIRTIHLRDQRFALPHLGLWDPEALFAASWGLYAGEAERVRISVHPAFIDLVRRRRWHPSQIDEGPGADGWIGLCFDVFPHGEFRTWILGWGPHVRVEHPPALRAWVERSRVARPGELEPDDDEVHRIV